MAELQGVYNARVTNNLDPTGHHRLRVQIPQLVGAVAMPWVMPGDPSVYTLPKIGSTVLVTFLSGDPSKPYWWGGNGETAVPQQIQDASAAISADFSDADTASSIADQAYTRAFSTQVTNRARAYKILDAGIGQNLWTNITWGSQDDWDGTNYAGGTDTSFIRQDGASYRLQVPASGEYLYTAVVSFDTTLASNSYYGLRAIWQQDSGNTANYVVAQTAPGVTTSFFEAIISICFNVDQSLASTVRIQARVSGAGGGTIQRDNVTGTYSVATRTRVDCVCVKRYDI